jgi:hypothetical protein
MENNTNGFNDNIIRPNTQANTITKINDIKYQNSPNAPIDGETLPYEDPAITNPQELASFPAPAKIVDAQDVENESESRLVNKRSPLREGQRITQTDNTPGDDGFI